MPNKKFKLCECCNTNRFYIRNKDNHSKYCKRCGRFIHKTLIPLLRNKSFNISKSLKTLNKNFKILMEFKKWITLEI